ncbi:RNA polymerase sigma factor [Pyxidicoccus trucidator]|uniref:RNA polymerase sigma factor n=1 Tax=Pyxidicoccus trucidator TaxID=2709662 RepID=UPI0013DBA9CC|nr:sigma-70 family RNA polymerase sigma factor [Pyxidicoccus trucidator]
MTAKNNNPDSQYPAEERAEAGIASQQPALLIAGLYRRFGGGVYRRAMFLLKDADDARDVTQDTFVALVEQLAPMRSPRESASLLYQMATSLAIDRLRHRARWFGPEGKPEPEAHPVESSQEGGARRIEAAKDLSLLTRGECPRTLQVAVLHFVEGQTLTEVGEGLDLSRKTVHRLLERFVSRARKRSTRLVRGSPYDTAGQ